MNILQLARRTSGHVINMDEIWQCVCVCICVFWLFIVVLLESLAVCAIARMTCIYSDIFCVLVLLSLPQQALYLCSVIQHWRKRYISVYIDDVCMYILYHRISSDSMQICKKDIKHTCRPIKCIRTHTHTNTQSIRLNQTDFYLTVGSISKESIRFKRKQVDQGCDDDLLWSIVEDASHRMQFCYVWMCAWPRNIYGKLA